jgi:hypothetical protein
MRSTVNVLKDRRGRTLMVGILLAVVAGCEGGGGAPPTAPSTGMFPTASASVATDLFPYDEEGAVVDAGTYRIPASAWSVAEFEVTFGKGWTVQYGHVFHRPSDSRFGLEFYAVVPDAIFADGCKGTEGALIDVGPSVDDFVTALREQRVTDASRPVATTLGGHPATRIDLAIPDGYDLSACNLGKIGLQIWYSPPADKYFVLLRDNPTSVYVVDVDGRRQVFIAGPVGPTTTKRDARELKAVLNSIRFDP